MKTSAIILSLTILLGAASCASPSTESTAPPAEKVYIGEPVEHVFPELPYAYDALEPYIDAQTMELHYNRHHRGYFNNFVNAIKDTPLENASLEFIFDQMSALSATVRNNGGGFYNHVLFWEVMAPGGKGAPSPELTSAINKAFGSMESFIEKFNQKALTQFGSGWAWLIVDDNGELKVTSTANQDNPLMDVVSERGIPILALDVWEHAYYLKYQNRRAEYVTNFWNLVNWDEVNIRYAAAK